MRPVTKPNGEKYYEYILCYVDYLLCISHDPKTPMNDIQSTLASKENKVDTPKFYPGEKLKKRDLDGKEVWIMSSADYIKSALENFEEQLKKKGDRIPSRLATQMSQGYYSETESSTEVYHDGITIFQELIGIL